MTEEAGLVINDAKEGQRMLYASSDKNPQPNFDWEVGYGAGFVVLHLNRKEAEQEIIVES